MSKLILRTYRWKGKPLSSIQPYLNFPRISVFSFGTHLLKVILGPAFTETLPCSRSHTALSEESIEKQKGSWTLYPLEPNFLAIGLPTPTQSCKPTLLSQITLPTPTQSWTNPTFTNYCSSPLHHCNYSTFSGPPRTTTLAKEHFTQYPTKIIDISFSSFPTSAHLIKGTLNGISITEKSPSRVIPHLCLYHPQELPLFWFFDL